MELNLKDLKELLNSGDKNKCCSNEHPYKLNENYLIRTITMIYTGNLIKVLDQELVLIKAAWIPETEQWNKTVAESIFKEVEMYPTNCEVIIGRSAILDATIISKLPSDSK